MGLEVRTESGRLRKRSAAVLTFVRFFARVKSLVTP